MLCIYLGKMDDVIYHPPTYFDNQYEDEWITDELSVEMIKDVDQSEVISASPERLALKGCYLCLYPVNIGKVNTKRLQNRF